MSFFLPLQGVMCLLAVCLILSPDPFPSLKHLGDPNTFSMWWRHTGFQYVKGFTIFLHATFLQLSTWFLQLPELTYGDKNRRYLHNTSVSFALNNWCCEQTYFNTSSSFLYFSHITNVFIEYRKVWNTGNTFSMC